MRTNATLILVIANPKQHPRVRGFVRALADNNFEFTSVRPIYLKSSALRRVTLSPTILLPKPADIDESFQTVLVSHTDLHVSTLHETGYLRRDEELQKKPSIMEFLKTSMKTTIDALRHRYGYGPNTDRRHP